jgi:Holliday junction resolvasome RuvABC ATP-dependent DNA helicase subunit
LIAIKMRRYSEDEMVEIMTLMLGGGDDDDIKVLAGASDGHPRTAEQIARTAKALGSTRPELVLRAVCITADGMTDDHFDYLVTLENTSRPLGVEQIATLVMSSNDEVKRLERGLISKGYVELTSSGRALTIRGQQYVRMLRDEGVIG